MPSGYRARYSKRMAGGMSGLFVCEKCMFTSINGAHWSWCGQNLANTNPKEQKQMSKFPHCEKLGLEVWPDAEYRCAKVPYSCPMIRADDVEKLLAEGKEIFFRQSDTTPFMSYAHYIKDSNDTHRGLTINIQPIKPKDSAEQVLKDFVDKCDAVTYEANRITRLDLAPIYDRAKKLVGKL